MYKVLLNNTVFYDARVDDLALINAVLNREENAAGTFEFIVAPEHPRYEELESRALVTVLRDDAILWQGVIVEIQTSLYKEKTVHCDGELVYLNESILRPKHYQGTTLQVFTEFINLHNAQVEPAKRFTLGMVTVTGRAINCYSNMESTMQCIKDHCIDTHGGVIRIRYADDKKYIDYLNAEDFRTSNQPIKLGLNIKDYSSNLDNTDICSGVIPLGAKDEQTTLEGVETRLTIASVNDGKDYLVKDSSIEKYGYIYKVLEYDDITSPSALKTRGEEFLNITQYENVVINVSAVDLALVDYGVNAFDLSDQIRVISGPHGLNKIFSLTAQTLNLLAPQNDVFTLGKEEKKSISAKTANVNDEIKKEIYNAVTPAASILESAKENATALLNGNGTGGYLAIMVNENGQPYEQLIMNTPSLETATRVWRYNQNGWGLGKRDNTSQPFTYTLAGTLDSGLIADVITAGTLQGVEIIGESGKIAGLNLTNKSLWVGTNSMSSNTAGIYLGTDGFRNVGVDTGQGYIPYTRISAGTLKTNFAQIDNLELGKATIDTNGLTICNASGNHYLLSLYNSSRNSRHELTMYNPNNNNRLFELYANYDGTGTMHFDGGDIFCRVLTQYSDKRLKENISRLDDDYIEEIYKLNPVGYEFKNDKDHKRHMGFIAQEVKELNLDGVVYEGERLSMSYDALIAPLVLTIQKQHAEIEELKKQLAEIKEALNG